MVVVDATAVDAAAGVGVVMVARCVFMVCALLRCKVVDKRWMQ